MTCLTVVTLKDHSQIQQVELIQTTICLIALRNDNRIAFGELIEKCRNPNYALAGSRMILRKWEFIDDDYQVYANIRTIVLNSIKQHGKLLLFVNLFKVNDLFISSQLLIKKMYEFRFIYT